MDLTSSLIYVGRVEDNDDLNKKELDQIEKDENIEAQIEGNESNAQKEKNERVTIIGSMKNNEYFDDELQSTNGVLNTIIDATRNQKTNIFEVNYN